MHETQVVSLPSGPVLVRLENSILHARGIPYAGAKRFEKPRPLQSNNTDGVLDCIEPATVCPQTPSRLENVIGPTTRGWKQSEQCLHLSITAPAQATSAPVMVFFHGGAYVTGGGDLDVYTGHGLSAQGMIVVSVTYRLSVFGYLRIPDYSPANLGLLDQIAALRWVQDNITAFGGDAKNVTIFGQSAGGDSVFCLLLAESMTVDLFHRAIIQSAPFDRYSSDRNPGMTDALALYAKQYLDTHINPSTTDLLALKDEVQSLGRDMDPTSILVFGTELGQEPLPEAQDVDDTLRRVASKIQIMIGWNRNEGTAFASPGPKFLQDSETITNKGFSDGAKYYQRLLVEVRPDSPSYEFTWSPPGSMYGATHCMELSFLLGSWDAWKAAPMLCGEESKSILETLGRWVKKVWIAFAQGKQLAGHHFVISEDFRPGVPL